VYRQGYHQMCNEFSICVIEEYGRMNKKCNKSWACPVGAIIFVGFSAACTTFGLLGIFSNASPAQGYSILFIVGLLGDSIVIPTTIIYLLGCILSDYYTLPTKALPGSTNGLPKPRVAIVSSSPILVHSPIRNTPNSSPKGGSSRKRSISQ
jgi:hypothetical protein